MKYAVLADIHACTDALERVLEDAEHQGAEKLIVAGDVVGYGPDPNGVVDILRAWDAVCVLGNHDAAVVGSGGTDGMIGSAREGVERHRRELGASELEWLKSLPLVHEDAVFGVAHGDFASPTKMSYLFDERDAQSSFFRTNAPVLFVGHTHLEARFEFGFISDPHFPDCIKTVPRDFRLAEGRRYLVNPGSVGCPRVQTYSSYVLFDSDADSVSFRKVAFDFAAYADEMTSRGLPVPYWAEMPGQFK